MRFFFLYSIIFGLIFWEATIGGWPLVLVIIFVLGLEVNSNNRFLGVFFSGLMIDLLTNSIFPAITLLFLIILLFAYLYCCYFPKNFLITFIFLLFFEYLYLYLIGVFPSLMLISGGLILFLPLQILMRYYLKFEKQKYLEFDILKR